MTEPVHPKIPVGPGSKTALGGISGVWIAAIVAAIDAGAGFYENNGVIGLFITAVASTLVFLGLRLPSVQLGTKRALGAGDELVARYNELKAKYEVALEGMQPDEGDEGSNVGPDGEPITPPPLPPD